MTKTRFLGGSLLVLTVTVGVLAFGPWTREAVAQEGSEHDFVMLRCATSSAFPVTAYQGSAAAPSKRAATCPQVLANLKKDGFGILDVGYSVEAEFVVYTLKR